MKRVAMGVIQLAITFGLVAVSMPPILVNVPAARGGTLGPAIAVALGVVVFLGLRLVWPTRWK